MHCVDDVGALNDVDINIAASCVKIRKKNGAV